MSMMTKQEATARAATQSAREIERVAAALASWAYNGTVGGSYVFPLYVSNADALAARDAAVAAGWTVVIDVPNRTMTFS